MNLFWYLLNAFGYTNTENDFKVTPNSAILKLKHQTNSLSKREAYLEAKIATECAKLKQKSIRKFDFENSLRKRKMLEVQLDSTLNLKFELEKQIILLENSIYCKNILNCLKLSSNVLENLNKASNLENFENVLSNLESQNQLSHQITESVLSKISEKNFDELEFERELDTMIRKTDYEKVETFPEDFTELCFFKETVHDEETELRKLKESMIV
ncbi:hypothetical protein HK099_005177 [Clydaea vesicula]|uniref:Uncharacterized protein n=1 Tax=Clydaea vesicula TaxID=447962 RepID=A0AAD5XXR7_9FUNG|nr:hypothetical protein HK099_005177 [Clydaea vesicula]